MKENYDLSDIADEDLVINSSATFDPDEVYPNKGERIAPPKTASGGSPWETYVKPDPEPLQKSLSFKVRGKIADQLRDIQLYRSKMERRQVSMREVVNDILVSFLSDNEEGQAIA